MPSDEARKIHSSIFNTTISDKASREIKKKVNEKIAQEKRKQTSLRRELEEKISSKSDDDLDLGW